MDAEFQIVREPIAFNDKGDDGEVLVKLLLELREISDVIDAFVEASGELRRDRLRRDAFIGDRGEDHEQLRWRLRRVGLIHRNLGDHVPRALLSGDVTINFPSFLHGEQELAGNALDLGARGLKGCVDLGNCNGADQLGMTVHRRGGVSDGIRYIEREKV